LQQSKCPFCEINSDEIIFKDKFCYVIYDRYPVNKGHLLIIPFRHFSSFFDSTKDERESILQLIDISKDFIDRQYMPDGYNIGVNIGKDAGQTIMHLHFHLIPRFKGDIADPTGGVRGVIPEKRVYKIN